MLARIDRHQKQTAAEALAVAVLATLLSAQLADIPRLVRGTVASPRHDEIADWRGGHLLGLGDDPLRGQGVVAVYRARHGPGCLKVELSLAKL